MPSDPGAGLDSGPGRGGPEKNRAPQRSGASLPGDKSNTSQPSRVELATAMKQQADDLMETHERLSGVWVDPDNARNVWIGNLEDVKECIISVWQNVKDCKAATKAGASLQLKTAIRQLEEELESSKAITEAAFRSLQVRDREGQFLQQSELHSRSIKQLPKLSSRCNGLARRLHGTHRSP